MKKIVIFLLLSTSIFGNNNFFSLKKIWELAEKNSPGLQARISQIKSIQQSIDALPSWYKPNVYADIGYTSSINQDSYAHGPLARVVLEWVLWDGGRRHFTRKHAEKKAILEKWEQMILAVKLKSSVAILFYSILRIEQLQDLFLEKINQLKKLTYLLRPRLRIGKIGKSNIVDIQLKIVRLNSQYKTLKTTASLAKKQLNDLIGKKGSIKNFQLQPLKKVKLLENFERSISLTSLPVFRLSEAKVESLEAQFQLIKRKLYWPSIGIETYGGYGPHLDAINAQKPEVGIGLKFNVPIFSSYDRASLLKSKKSAIQSSKLDLKQRIIQAKINFNMKLGKLKNNIRESLDLQSNIIKGKSNLILAYREFSRGLKSSYDMIDTVKSLFEHRKQLIDLRVQSQLIKAEIDLLVLYSKRKFLKK